MSSFFFNKTLIHIPSGFNRSESVTDEDDGKRRYKKQSSNHEQDPSTSQDSTIKVVITSNKPEALTQVTELNSNDAEGLFAFEERSAGDLSGTSSISSTFSFKSNDDCHILTKVYFNLPTAENNDHTGLNPENKKVTFYYQKTGAVKRRSPLRKCDGSAIKQTEHPLISTTSSSWFSQSSCEEIIILENGNEREKKERNDPPAQFDQDVCCDTNIKKDEISGIVDIQAVSLIELTNNGSFWSLCFLLPFHTT